MMVLLDYGITIHDTIIFIVIAFVIYTVLQLRKGAQIGKLPPQIPYSIPWVGNAIDYGVNPTNLFLEGYRRFGEIFRIKIAGQTITMLVGPEAQKRFFETPEEELCARKAYTFMTPVFGKNIVFDANHDALQQQRRFVGGGLTKRRLELYVNLIIEECSLYTSQAWKSGKGQTDMLQFFNELLTNTAARCLQGTEVRCALRTGPFSRLMQDLDNALSAISYFFPYLPIPVNIRRDRSRIKIVQFFKKIIEDRISTNKKCEDMIQVFMESCYTDGTKLNCDEIAGLCIALMLAGQHTSNVTSAWLGCYIMTLPNVRQRLLEEIDVAVPKGSQLTLEAFKSMPFFHNCLKETLRLNPPIIIMQRYAEVDFKYKDFVAPKGTLVAVSPAVAHRLNSVYTNPNEFNPDRFELREDKSHQYSYLPFGAGRHACIGEQFAYVQIKTVWFYLLRNYCIELASGKMPQPDYTTMIVSPIKPIINYKRL